MKGRMFTALILAGLVAAFGFAPDTIWAKEKIEDEFEKTVSLSRDGQVTLSNISGNIEVKTWNRNEVQIKALKTSKADTREEARENADLVKIEVVEDGNAVHIKTKYPQNRSRRRSLNVSVAYWLNIPDRADADINSVSGDILMTRIGGNAEAVTVSGDVDLSEPLGGRRRPVSVLHAVCGPRRRHVESPAFVPTLTEQPVAGGSAGSRCAWLDLSDCQIGG